MSSPRRAAAAFLAGYSLALIVVLLSSNGTPGSTAVDVISRGLADLGAPDALADPDHVEVALNVAIFFPWAALAMIVWPTTHWQDWAAYGFVATLLVESFQGLALGDHRAASLSDVVANALGALLGALAVHVLRRVRGHAPDVRAR